MASITVVNKRFYSAPHMSGDRSSVLGNRYSHLKDSKAEFIVKTREESLELAKEDIYNRLEKGEEPLLQTIASIIVRYNSGEDIVLGCWCKPKDCHLDYIKSSIEDDTFILIPAVEFAVSFLTLHGDCILYS